MEQAIRNFISTYQRLDENNLMLLSTIYAANVHFIDPAHEFQGIKSLEKYFSGLYRNSQDIRFEFEDPDISGEYVLLRWSLSFSHPRLKKGQTISVPGISRLHFNLENLVDFHHDYFDLGAMLYEHLPLIGRVIRALKERLGS